MKKRNERKNGLVSDDSKKGELIMEYEQDFISLLVVSQSIDELVEALKTFQKDSYNIISFHNGQDIKISTIIEEIQHMINEGCEFGDIAFELLETHCTLLDYLY